VGDFVPSDRMVEAANQGARAAWAVSPDRMRDGLKAAFESGEPVPHVPHRGSDVEAWIKEARDEYPKSTGYPESPEWLALDGLLDDYRLHADTGTPLDSDEPMGPTVAGVTDDA
jgi:hypothetical protein